MQRVTVTVDGAQRVQVYEFPIEMVFAKWVPTPAVLVSEPHQFLPVVSGVEPYYELQGVQVKTVAVYEHGGDGLCDHFALTSRQQRVCLVWGQCRLQHVLDGDKHRGAADGWGDSCVVYKERVCGVLYSCWEGCYILQQRGKETSPIIFSYKSCNIPTELQLGQGPAVRGAAAGGDALRPHPLGLLLQRYVHGDAGVEPVDELPLEDVDARVVHEELVEDGHRGPHGELPQTRHHQGRDQLAGVAVQVQRVCSLVHQQPDALGDHVVVDGHGLLLALHLLVLVLVLVVALVLGGVLLVLLATRDVHQLDVFPVAEGLQRRVHRGGQGHEVVQVQCPEERVVDLSGRPPTVHAGLHGVEQQRCDVRHCCALPLCGGGKQREFPLAFFHDHTTATAHTHTQTQTQTWTCSGQQRTHSHRERPPKTQTPRRAPPRSSNNSTTTSPRRTKTQPPRSRNGGTSQK